MINKKPDFNRPWTEDDVRVVWKRLFPVPIIKRMGPDGKWIKEIYKPQGESYKSEKLQRSERSSGNGQANGVAHESSERPHTNGKMREAMEMRSWLLGKEK